MLTFAVLCCHSTFAKSYDSKVGLIFKKRCTLVTDFAVLLLLFMSHSDYLFCCISRFRLQQVVHLKCCNHFQPKMRLNNNLILFTKSPSFKTRLTYINTPFRIIHTQDSLYFYTASRFKLALCKKIFRIIQSKLNYYLVVINLDRPENST